MCGFGDVGICGFIVKVASGVICGFCFLLFVVVLRSGYYCSVIFVWFRTLVDCVVWLVYVVCVFVCFGFGVVFCGVGELWCFVYSVLGFLDVGSCVCL